MGQEQSKGQVLGSSSGGGASSSPAAPPKGVPPRSSSQPQPSSAKSASSSSSQKHKDASGDADRQARLAAIEARMGAAEKRGVQKTGGKLAAKLEENKKGAGTPAAGGAADEAADLWRAG